MNGILVASHTASVTAGVNKRRHNAQPEISINSGSLIVQPWSWRIGLFGWIIIIDTRRNDQRLRHRQRFRLGERFRIWYWFWQHERYRKQYLWYRFNQRKQQD
jgi:hypothetical protein